MSFFLQNPLGLAHLLAQGLEETHDALKDRISGFGSWRMDMDMQWSDGFSELPFF